MHLHSGKEIHNPTPPTTFEHFGTLEKQDPKKKDEGHVSESDENGKTSTTPPFPKRLESQNYDPATYFLLEELKNLYVKIPLLHAIREISIYTKFIKETCMKEPRMKKKKDPATINVVGHLVDIMLGKFLNPKYENHGGLVVTVNIINLSISKTLIDLGEKINAVTNDTMLRLNPQPLLRHTTTILLGYSSTICLEGMLEDIIMCIESLEYPIDLIVLIIKNKLNGYSLILERTWLATIDAYTVVDREL